jgi:hypothetical protein
MTVLPLSGQGRVRTISDLIPSAPSVHRTISDTKGLHELCAPRHEAPLNSRNDGYAHNVTRRHLYVSPSYIASETKNKSKVDRLFRPPKAALLKRS